jgi:thioredoxin-dependent peroxiredoxin
VKPFAAVALALTIGSVALFSTSTRAVADLLRAGDLAPQFSTQAIEGDETVPVKLSDYHGKTVALYFYPKDFTTGCTTEACTFRDSYAKIQSAGIVLLGCSIDTAESHQKFIKQYSLPFPLLLDPEKKIATAYGVANGIPQYGLDGRVTYIIGGDGKILKVYPKVDPSTNASQIISEFGSGKTLSKNNE